MVNGSSKIGVTNMEKEAHTWAVVMGTAPGCSIRNCLSSRRSTTGKFSCYKNYVPKFTFF